MVVTYRNNRLVPAIIMATCIVLVYCLLGPALDYGQVMPGALADKAQSAKPHVEAGATAHNETVDDAPDVAVEDSSEPEAKAQDRPIGGSLSGDDVLLMMKTGGTTMWKRLLVHLTTTLSSARISPANVVIYSDYPQAIGAFTVVDALANMTESAKSKPDFDIYRQQPEYMANNHYAEAAGVNGDEWGPTGGWVIDKYKFVPLMQHAGNHWPRAKWYVYMEDDTYLFLPNVLAYLSQFDWQQPHYLGSYAAKSNVVFAHGGAGFAVSRGAWEQSFGRSANMTEEYYQYTADHCCGDQVLGLALGDHGVKFGENGGDEKFTWGFNPVVHWSFAFSKHNWCHPLLSWHKVHNRDVAEYYELEKEWDFTKPLLHRDFFNKQILPSIKAPIRWWDNQASVYEVTSANKDSPPVPEGDYSSSLWKNAWETVDACEKACRGWKECVSWSYVEDLCKMDDKIVMGQGFASGMSQRKTSLMHTSGWVPDRLDTWRCDE